MNVTSLLASSSTGDFVSLLDYQGYQVSVEAIQMPGCQLLSNPNASQPPISSTPLGGVTASSHPNTFAPLAPTAGTPSTRRYTVPQKTAVPAVNKDVESVFPDALVLETDTIRGQGVDELGLLVCFLL